MNEDYKIDDQLEDEEQEPVVEGSKWKDAIQRSKVVMNVQNPAQITLVDLASGHVKRGIRESIIPRLFRLKQRLKLYRENVLIAEYTYNPHVLSPLSYDEETGCEVYNDYIPPKWKKAQYFFGEPLPPSPPAPPPIIDEYFTHLFKNHAPSISFAHDWLATALRSRNYTILCAIGEKGVGKGVLGQLMSKIFGEANFVKVRDTVFKEKFNGQLRNKQLVYVDEVAIKSKEQADRIKDVVNEKIEIEAKGEDAIEVVNYASFYLTSNRFDAIQIEPKDRRFSIIELTDTSFLDSKVYARLDELLSDETVKQYSLYLLGRTIENDMSRPFRSSERYDEIIEAGLAEWELHLIENFFPDYKKDDEINLTAVQDAVNHKFPYMHATPGRKKLEDLCKKYPNYLHMKRDTSSGTRKIKVLQQIPRK